MKEFLNLWLSRNTCLPGFLAGSVRYADRMVFARSWDPGIPTPALEGAWRVIEDALQLLQANRLPSGRCCWTYEHARLHVVRRPDGISLGLLTTREAQPLQPEQVDRVLAEFEGLRPPESG